MFFSGKKSLIIFCSVLAACVFLFSCGSSKGSSGGKIKSIAVFVPGAVSGSPIYEQLVAGAKRAADEEKLAFSVYEAGFNQAEWGEKLNQLAASGKWDLIVSSNPSMPALCVEALKVAPKQRFFVADGYLAGNANLATVLYNQVEQAFPLGYLAGLLTRSMDPEATVVGVVVAQRYPTFDQAILPGFEKGLAEADPNMRVSLRLIGNWYDAAKAMELSKALFDSGAQVIFPIAGGAAQGVVTAAKDKGRKVLWFDSSAYSMEPGTIAACAMLRQEKLVYERVAQAVKGKLAYGKAEILSMKDGYVDFDDADPLYLRNIPQDIRDKMAAMLGRLRSGELSFESPTF
jgi:simple sugar transport system substrate-binding protein